jgi:hypothetical protein
MKIESRLVRSVSLAAAGLLLGAAPSLDDPYCALMLDR